MDLRLELVLILDVLARGGLLAMKRIAGRPQDLADIARLTEENDEEA